MIHFVQIYHRVIKCKIISSRFCSMLCTTNLSLEAHLQVRCGKRHDVSRNYTLQIDVCSSAAYF